MVEPRSDTSGEDGLSWAGTAASAPAVLRTGLLAGQRLITWTATSTMFLTRSAADTVSGVRTPADVLGAARDGIVGALRDVLGVADLEAEVQRLTGHPGPGRDVGAWATIAPPTRGPSVPGSATRPGSGDDTAGASADPDRDGGDDGGDDGGRRGHRPSTGTPTDATTDATSDPTTTDATSDPTTTDATSDPTTTGPAPDATSDVATDDDAHGHRVDLRDRGRELLARSATLDADEEHPAFGMVLEQIAPDEMRILRVLVRNGDQATVDVETSGVLGGRGPVVARRVSLLAETAGCKHPERLPVYLDNLVRLGLVRVGDDPLDDGAYEVIEAQPRVDEARQEASRGASRARLTRRRLELSDFGDAFCRSALPAE